MKTGSTGGYLLPYWKIICNDKNNDGKLPNFIKATKTHTPTSQKSATTLHRKGTSFMYIEATSANSGSDNVFCSFERTDIIKVSNKTFY